MFGFGCGFRRRYMYIWPNQDIYPQCALEHFRNMRQHNFNAAQLSIIDPIAPIYITLRVIYVLAGAGLGPLEELLAPIFLASPFWGSG